MPPGGFRRWAAILPGYSPDFGALTARTTLRLPSASRVAEPECDMAFGNIRFAIDPDDDGEKPIELDQITSSPFGHGMFAKRCLTY
jgi:hypothetical protein